MIVALLAAAPTRHHLIVQNASRYFYYQLPSGSSPAAGWPLVVSYHVGAAPRADKPQWMACHRLGTSAIVVHPEGYSDPTDCGPYPCDEWQSFNGGGSAGVEAGGTDGPICKPEDVSRTGWQCYESCKALGYCDDTTDKCRWSHCLDDALFFRAILQYLQRVSTVDDTRLFATGHSNGAMMMYGLASDNKTAPLLAAVAPVAGIPHNGFNVGAPSNTKLRYMEVQGTQDDYAQPYPNVPGRPDKSFGKSYGWYYSAWANTTNLWAKQRGVTGGRTKLTAPNTFNCTGWNWRSGGGDVGNETAVATCFYDGGHSPPSAAWDLVVAFFGLHSSGGSCPPCGGYTCDEWIAWDPSRYSCPELEKDWGCDCSGCDCGHEEAVAVDVPRSSLVGAFTQIKGPILPLGLHISLLNITAFADPMRFCIERTFADDKNASVASDNRCTPSDTRLAALSYPIQGWEPRLWTSEVFTGIEYDVNAPRITSTVKSDTAALVYKQQSTILTSQRRFNSSETHSLKLHSDELTMTIESKEPPLNYTFVFKLTDKSMVPSPRRPQPTELPAMEEALAPSSPATRGVWPRGGLSPTWYNYELNATCGWTLTEACTHEGALLTSLQGLANREHASLYLTYPQNWAFSYTSQVRDFVASTRKVSYQPLTSLDDALKTFKTTARGTCYGIHQCAPRCLWRIPMRGSMTRLLLPPSSSRCSKHTDYRSSRTFLQPSKACPI